MQPDDERIGAVFGDGFAPFFNRDFDGLLTVAVQFQHRDIDGAHAGQLVAAAAIAHGLFQGSDDAVGHGDDRVAPPDG